MLKKSLELEIAIKAALEAGKILEKYFETGIEHGLKDDKSIITAADGESEEIIKKIILENFPDHSIFGEETGLTKNTHKYTWHVDPVDGTRNFARGVPLFAVSVALVDGDNILLGVVYNPVTKSLFYAEFGKGAYLNDNKISVSKNDNNHSMITISRGKQEQDEKIFRELMYFLPKNHISSVRDFGCAALDLSFTAMGVLDADIQFGLHTYDFAAGILIVKEAGGTITNLDGSPWKFPENRFIASNGIFHDILVKEVQKQKEKLQIK